MKALELISNDNSWLTLVILFIIILLALLKLKKPNTLVNYSVAFFTPGFFQKRAEEGLSIFSLGNFLVFIINTLVFSLLLSVVFKTSYIQTDTFLGFLTVFVLVFSYLLIKYFIDLSITNIFGIQKMVNYFLHVKYGYLFTLSLWVLPILIVNEYYLHSDSFLLFCVVILLIFKVFLVVFNNKNIIISKLFYFILYFCTLEIAPLLILYKTTTT